MNSAYRCFNGCATNSRRSRLTKARRPARRRNESQFRKLNVLSQSMFGTALSLRHSALRDPRALAVGLAEVDYFLCWRSGFAQKKSGLPRSISLTRFDSRARELRSAASPAPRWRLCWAHPSSTVHPSNPASNTCHRSPSTVDNGAVGPFSTASDLKSVLKFLGDARSAGQMTSVT